MTPFSYLLVRPDKKYVYFLVQFAIMNLRNKEGTMKTIDYEIDIKVTNLLLGDGETDLEGVELDITEEEAEEILKLMGIEPEGVEDECILNWC